MSAAEMEVRLLKPDQDEEEVVGAGEMVVACVFEEDYECLGRRDACDHNNQSGNIDMTE